MAADVGGGDGGGGRKKAKKGRAKKANPRIDMTPMVDLGFLLLTFFVLTTTMVTPKSMPVVMPEKDNIKKEDQQEVPASKVLHLLMGQKNRIFYYQAADPDPKSKKAADIKMEMTTFSKDGIRKVIAEKRREINEKWKNDKDQNPMIVLIKLADNANYKNFVDILDEMAIMEVTRFATLDISKTEIEMIGDYEKAEGLQ